jgi:propanol-preferring alcohol dehydrogenase
MVVPEAFAYSIPDVFNDSEAAPLLCAGAIGYRSLRLTNLQNGQNLGLMGFGASGHLVLKTAKYMYPDSNIFVFARNPNERTFAKDLGATWAGDTAEKPPEKPDAIIDTTPVWKPVVEALKHLDAAGRLVINAIRKENMDINYLKNISYPEHLWLEKEIKSVANVERRDVREFLDIAAKIPIKPDYEEYPLAEANKALMEIKNSKIRGAKVLKMN